VNPAMRSRGVAQLVPPLSDRPSISGSGLLDTRLRDVIIVFAGVVADVVVERLADRDPHEAAHQTDRTPRALSRRGIAEHIGVSLPTVDRLVGEGMPHVRIGDSPRFFASDVVAWLKTRGSV
jgi:excisionase family DNA binding protein